MSMTPTLFAGLITVAGIFVIVAIARSAAAAWDWYGALVHAENQPPHRLYGAVWLPSMTLFIVAIWILAASDVRLTGWFMAIAGLSLLGAWRWPVRFFTKHDLRNSFTLACSEWVVLALTAAAAAIFLPWAGLLMVPLLLATTAGGFYNFVVWQLN